MPAAPDEHPVVARLAALRQAGADAAVQRCLAVRDLVVVCSSSRGGSSLFGELLRRSPAVVAFSAEINPHVVIPTIGTGGCDVVADPERFAGAGEGLRVLRQELGADLGRPATDVDAAEFARHVAWRLTMQWPNESIDLDHVSAWVADVVATGVSPAAREDFLLALLARVRTAHPAVNPYRYDIADDAVAAAFPRLAAPAGPPAEPVVEMAPFVLPRPWRHATAAEAASAPVVSTTPRNAFRLPLLARAFPNARLRVVHLTRNPAAAVNGLRDGWRHRGFFSCRTQEPLSIRGYSDEFPDWGTQWWNYDVPPGWRAWTDRPLPDVCGFQWRAAHEATVEAAARAGAEVHRIAFEEVVAPGGRRRAAMTSLCDWLGVDPGPILADEDLPVVMPTASPRPRRWQDNAALLEPVIRDRRILDTARMLGYQPDPATWL